MVNFKLSRSVAKTTLGRQIQHHAVASPRDRIIHLISNLTTPPDENGRKQLGQMQSGTRLLRRVTLYSPCKSISQLAYLQRFTGIESILPLEGESRIHFQGVTKWTVQATSFQRGEGIGYYVSDLTWGTLFKGSRWSRIRQTCPRDLGALTQVQLSHLAKLRFQTTEWRLLSIDHSS